MSGTALRARLFHGARPLIACVGVGMMLAYLALCTPAARPETSPATSFSAARAMRDVHVIAQRPHPIGSAEAARIRDFIDARLRSLQLQTRIQRDEAFFDGWRLPPVIGTVENVIGVLPGRSPDLPAVVVMSHYDTVPNSPGAGDDTAGVAAALELAANLRASGPLERTVIFLFTDGEEAGLLGATAFFERDPLSPQVGVVLNMEARGAGGRAAMFETNMLAGNLVRLWAAYASTPVANSLMASVYHRMPNGTDLTVALQRGLPGMNFAFSADHFAYHTMVASAGRLDPGSLQHLGDQVLPIALALASAAELPAQGPDLVYFDVLGWKLILYPPWMGWCLAILAAAIVIFTIFRAYRMGSARVSDLARGACAPLLVVSATALCLRAAGAGISASSTSQMYALLGRYAFELAGATALAGAVAAILVIAQLRGAGQRWILVAAWSIAAVSSALSGALDWVAIILAALVSLLGLVTLRAAASAWGYWLGALATAAILAVALQSLAPLAAFMLTWPVLGACMAGALTLRRPSSLDSPRGLLISGLVGTALFAQLAYWAGTLFNAIGSTQPWILAPFVMLSILVLFPLLRASIQSTRAAVAACVVAIALGTLLVAFARMDRSSSTEIPRMREAFFIADVTGGRYYRGTQLSQPDDWSWAALQIDGGQPKHAAFEPLFSQKLWLAETRLAGAIGPLLDAERTPTADGTQVAIHIRSRNSARQVSVQIRSSHAARNVTLNGHAIGSEWLARSHEWARFMAYAPRPEGLTLRFDSDALARIEVHATEVVDGWPRDVVPPSPPPAGTMPTRLSDTTMFIGHLVLDGK